jgi:hypothetical protein
MLLDAIDHRVAFNTTEPAPEEFHNSGIGIHGGKRFPILVTPLTQEDATAGQFHKGAPSLDKPTEENRHWRFPYARHVGNGAASAQTFFGIQRT